MDRTWWEGSLLAGTDQAQNLNEPITPIVNSGGQNGIPIFGLATGKKKEQILTGQSMAFSFCLPAPPLISLALQLSF
jgi:hypothetical protein